jgi:hypothetical protein
MLKLLIIIIIFILGLYYTTCPEKVIEGFSDDGKTPYRCPNILIQKGSKYYLHNSRLAKVPGVNPLQFDHLDDYVEFMNWQRSQGIRCPVLYVQESYDAQGNPELKARPSPFNMQGGLQNQPITPAPVQDTSKLIDAGRDDSPYNENSFPAYDQDNQNVGLYTPLDKMFHETNGQVSPNPMDSTWGGREYTQQLVDAGYYEEDEVTASTNTE